MTSRAVLVVFCLYLSACNNSGTDNPAIEDVSRKAETSEGKPVSETGSTLDSVNGTGEYFPVLDFLKSEIAFVDSLPVGIMKYKTEGSRTDSAYMKSAEFRELASEFLPPQLQHGQFKKNFKESAFLDKLTGAATFYYNPNDPAGQVTRVDVVTEKGDVYDQVKSIYIEKRSVEGDADLHKKLYWKPKRYFQIITHRSRNGADPETAFVKVVWDNRE